MKILKITTMLLLLSLCSLAWADIQCPATEGGRSINNIQIMHTFYVCYYNYYNKKAYSRAMIFNDKAVAHQYAKNHPDIWKADARPGLYMCKSRNVRVCKIVGVSSIRTTMKTTCKSGADPSKCKRDEKVLYNTIPGGDKIIMSFLRDR